MSGPLRVLHVSKFYYPHIGGIEDVCRSLVRGLRHCEQRVVCFSDDRNSVTDYDGAVPIIRGGCFLTLASQPLSLSLYKLLRDTLSEFRPHIVHFHVPNPLVYFYLHRLLPPDVKLVLHWHSDIVAQRYLYHGIRRYERLMLERCDRIIVTSPLYLSGSFPLRAYRDKCVVVPCPVSFARLAPTAEILSSAARLREHYGGKPIVFFMGRHVPYKGLDRLIASARRVQTDCVFLIAGSGPLTARLQSQCSDMSNIHFVGKIPDEAVSSYMYASSVFAFPSVTKNEAFGVVLAEAMYCKLPPVVFSIEGSGVNWVSVSDETGLEVPNGDVSGYAAALDRLLCDAALRERLGNCGHERVVGLFSDKIVCEQTRRVYEELCDGAEGRCDEVVKD